MRALRFVLMLAFLLTFSASLARADGGYGIVFVIIELEALKITKASCDKSEPSTRKTNSMAWQSFEQKNQDFMRWYTPWLKTQSDPARSGDSIQRFAEAKPTKCKEIPNHLTAISLALADEWPVIQRRINAGPPR